MDVRSFGIFGSGFGLYGYLPAVLNLGYSATIPARYLESLNVREELLPYRNRVSICKLDDDIVRDNTAIIIAKNPDSQLVFLQNLVQKKKFLFLEKPLAPTVESHLWALDFLVQEKIKFAIAYLFPFTNWYSKVLEYSEALPVDIYFDWKITKPASPWKNDEKLGGGIRSYYLVHFAPLLNDLGANLLDDKILLKESANSFDLKIFLQGKSTNLRISFNFSSVSQFKLIICDSFNGKPIYVFDEESPFGNRGRTQVSDSRIPQIQKYIRDSMERINTARSIDIERTVLAIRSLE